MEQLKRKWNNLRKLSLKQAITKIAIKIYETVYYKIRGQVIKLHPININPKYFENFTTKSTFLFYSSEENLLYTRIKELKIEQQILEEANEICNHRFNLLGSRETYLGSSIPWNKDFKSNFIWDNKYYKFIRTVDLTNDADVKIPWELSRFQHFFTLGKAYFITKDEKYAYEFKEQVEDWIKKNPVEMSVNWTCTMDVAIRSVNWIAVHSFFQSSTVLDESFWNEYNSSLYSHGKYIMNNLENKGSYTGNHYLSNIVGLVWLGIYFQSINVKNLKGNKHHKRWLEYGLEELEKEMFIQNNEDGTNYEASTSYHRLVTELFLITTIICNKNGIHFTNEYMTRLEKMCGFLLDITKPNGLAPIIGDADDGRLLILSSYKSWIKNDFRHLLGIAGTLFNRNDFSYCGKDYEEDTLWIFHHYRTKDEEPINYPLLVSTSYKDGGYYILRNKRVYCLIRCGELSFRGDGVHSHNDQLSFELTVDGEDFIVDPGSYIYTGNFRMRNMFRSTEMHNTVQIERSEQNDFDDQNLFYMKEQTYSKCIDFKKNFFLGKHVGYLKKHNVIHQRSFSLKENYLSIHDELIGENNIIAQAIFHLAPDVNYTFTDNKLILMKNSTIITINKIDNFQVMDSYVSGSYGIKTPSKRVVVEFKRYTNINLKFN